MPDNRAEQIAKLKQSNNDEQADSVTNVSGDVNSDAVGWDKVSGTQNVDTGGGANVGGNVTVEDGSEFVGRDKTTVNNIRQFIMSPSGLIGLAVICAVTVLLITGVIKPQEPLPFTPATANESLIIVTDLKDNSDGQCSIPKLSQRVYDNLNTWIENDGLSQMGVVARHLIDRAQGKEIEDIGNQAKQIGEQYNATLLLWGSYDLAGITTNLQYVKPNSHIQAESANPNGTITSKLYSLQLIVPNSLCDKEDQLYPLSTCQALVTLGFEEYLVERFDVALDYLNEAIKKCGAPTARPPFICGGNRLLSHIYASAGNFYKGFVHRNLYRLLCTEAEGPPHP
jgi:hypothetical protein